MATPETFNRAAAFVLSHEGGLVDDPRDPGGLTHFGIALNRHPELTAADIQDMTQEGAVSIYRTEYWDAFQGDSLPDPIAFVMLDAAVNQGTEAAIQYLQLAVGAHADGLMGPATLAASNKVLTKDFLEAFAATRIAHYSAFKQWPIDGKGWTRRTVRAALEALA